MSLTTTSPPETQARRCLLKANVSSLSDHRILRRFPIFLLLLGLASSACYVSRPSTFRLREILSFDDNQSLLPTKSSEGITPAGRAVSIVASVPSTCRFLGYLTASAYKEQGRPEGLSEKAFASWLPQQQARVTLQNVAGEKQADHLVIDGHAHYEYLQQSFLVLYGRAWRCQTLLLPESPPASRPASLPSSRPS